MDGLVSTGNKFPSTILEINFFNQKKIPNYFINILNMAVDKPALKKGFFMHSTIFYKPSLTKYRVTILFSIV